MIQTEPSKLLVGGCGWSHWLWNMGTGRGKGESLGNADLGEGAGERIVGGEGDTAVSTRRGGSRASLGGKEKRAGFGGADYEV